MSGGSGFGPLRAPHVAWFAQRNSSSQSAEGGGNTQITSVTQAADELTVLEEALKLSKRDLLANIPRCIAPPNTSKQEAATDDEEEPETDTAHTFTGADDDEANSDVMMDELAEPDDP